jgi:pyruvate/2-oxoglutarate dehydrogenase complex dihydrolipoamide acyltransferase (E2) component
MEVILVRFVGVSFSEFLVIDGNEIVYRDYVDISVAVATPKVFIVYIEIYSENEGYFVLGLSRTGTSKCGENEFC